MVLTACAPAERSLTDTFARQPRESWFGIYVDGEKRGYARFTTAVDAQGYHFRTSAALRHGDEDWERWHTDETFAARAPHRLTRHLSVRSRGGASRRLELTGDVDGYRLQTDDGEQPLQLDFTLADRLQLARYVALLPATAAGDLVTRNLDLRTPATAISERHWQLVATDPPVLAATDGLRRVELDANGQMMALRVGSGFLMRREAPGLAQLVAPPARRATVSVPVDRPLGTPMRVQRLRVRVPALAAAVFGTGPDQTLEPQADGSAIIEINRVPQRAAAQPGGNRPTQPGSTLTQAQQVDWLVSWLHTNIAYDESVEPLDGRDALARGAGSCTDFAAAFALLAEQTGLPARTVTGLVYAGDASFMLHAWNEVEVNGHWQAVDATWGQRQTDATHIRLPIDPDALLQAFEVLPQLRFELLAVEQLPAAAGSGSR